MAVCLLLLSYRQFTFFNNFWVFIVFQCCLWPLAEVDLALILSQRWNIVLVMTKFLFVKAVQIQLRNLLHWAALFFREKLFTRMYVLLRINSLEIISCWLFEWRNTLNFWKLITTESWWEVISILMGLFEVDDLADGQVSIKRQLVSDSW